MSKKYKLVISGGDSFTFGAELHNKNENPKIPHYSSWANVVASKIGTKHLNLARSGRSNAYIVRHILDTLVNTDVESQDIFVQVMWTFTDRYEYALDKPTNEYDSPWYPFSVHSADNEAESSWFSALPKSTENWKFTRDSLLTKWNRSLNLGVVDFAKQYNRVVHMNPLNNSYINIKDILLLQNYLKLHNIDYMFTYVNHYVTDSLKKIAVNNPGSQYLNSIRTLIDWEKWFEFPGNINYSGFGFDDWARLNNYSYATSHPLELAHRDCADLIVNQIY